ncbi:MAG: hypothetical protein KFB92_15355 [Alcanivorax sp.]|nr:MAG: hypothetical protein KFB92_15355 [Alcanivorax sp.]
MITEPIPSWLVITVIVIALFAGISCITTSNLVWFRHRLFGVGGSILSFCGVVLIGLSVWGNIQIEGKGWKLNLERVAEALENNPEAVQELISEIARTDSKLSFELAREIIAKNSPASIDTVAHLVDLTEASHSDSVAATSVPTELEIAPVVTVSSVGLSSEHVGGPIECEVPKDVSAIASLNPNEYIESGAHPQRYTWYKFQPSTAGLYLIDVSSSSENGDTVLSVYTSGSMEEIIFHDDDSGEDRSSRLLADFDADKKYYMCVSHYGDAKPFSVIVSKTH